MVGFFSPQGTSSRSGSTHSTTAARFRLVDDVVTSEAPPREARDGFEELVSPRLLVSAEDWAATPPPLDTTRREAEIPLIASLARIRSEADAALALTGVLELMTRRFRIALPCGHTGDGGLSFHAPEALDTGALGRAIDEALLGIVRATDLQGGMRERVRTRVT